MGSIGSSTSSGTSTIPTTRENEYGFEVENTNSPELEFTDRLWKEMAELRGYGVFEDSELRDRVDSKISELVDQYDDLARYDEDLTNLRERIENTGVTDDEYWAGYHVMANMLGIKQNRYTVLENAGGAGWDERFSSVEQAEAFANERSDAKYIYDTWKRKGIKIGGKTWRKM